MPLGNLNIDMKLDGRAKEYKRGLDLENAAAFTEFLSGETRYRREVFVSEPDCPQAAKSKAAAKVRPALRTRFFVFIVFLL